MSNITRQLNESFAPELRDVREVHSRLREPFSKPYTNLYLKTLLLELITGLWRFVHFLVPLFLVFLILGAFFKYDTYFGPDWERRMGLHSMQAYRSAVLGGALKWSMFWAFVLSYANIFLSLQALWAGGGYLTRFVLGARQMSTREKDTIYAALLEIAERAERPVKGFSAVYILDTPFDQVNLIGTTLYISSGAVQSESLRVILAHEIGHLDNDDGRIVLALRRMVFVPFQFFLAGVRKYSTNAANPKPELKEFEAMAVFFFLMNKLIFVLCALWGGGLGVWLTSWHWAKFFRETDYKADVFVASLGYKDQLIEYLEQGKFYDTAVPYMAAWHPANELRIDRLLYPQEREVVSQIAPAGAD
jgi:Zn-dependent protease with chaperone function